ncbi:MAG: exodeoxyribonuclease VII small subunit [Hyphomicrobiaceae bacterium]|nr:exodeoxyribonuclease VII small subunit [Hyphomicrobiaceae bacterium]
MADKNKADDIGKMTFEAAMQELEQIVAKLEKGDVELEESIAIYERGEALRSHCDALLKKAEAKVEKITLDAEGQPAGTEPLDVED